MNPDTALHRPPTKRQIKSAQAHQRAFAKWADKLTSPKLEYLDGFDKPVWYVEERRKT